MKKQTGIKWVAPWGTKFMVSKIEGMGGWYVFVDNKIDSAIGSSRTMSSAMKKLYTEYITLSKSEIRKIVEGE